MLSFLNVELTVELTYHLIPSHIFYTFTMPPQLQDSVGREGGREREREVKSPARDCVIP